MLISMWNWLVWLATVDFMWIPAGISMFFLFCIYALQEEDIKGTLPFCASVFLLWFLVLGSSYGNGSSVVPSRFPHFLYWHLLVFGVVIIGMIISSFTTVNFFKKGWWTTKKFIANIFVKWQNKRRYLEDIRGTKISEELELRRKELEKLMDDGVISESIRAQVSSLFGGSFKRLLVVRQFLLENVPIFDAAEARTVSNPSTSVEIKKEISERRARLCKMFEDVNTRLNQIATTIDVLIIRMGEIRVGLGQGSTGVEATLKELNEMVSAIEEGVLSETQQTSDTGMPVLPERTTIEESSSVVSPAREGVKV